MKLRTFLCVHYLERSLQRKHWLVAGVFFKTFGYSVVTSSVCTMCSFTTPLRSLKNILGWLLCFFMCWVFFVEVKKFLRQNLIEFLTWQQENFKNTFVNSILSWIYTAIANDSESRDQNCWDIGNTPHVLVFAVGIFTAGIFISPGSRNQITRGRGAIKH